MTTEKEKMLAIQRHCYRYVVIGLGVMVPTLGGGTECPEPPCTPAYPGIAVSGEWEKGYIQIQPTDPAVQFRPRAISAVDFSSIELAQFWLHQTESGKGFLASFPQVIITRVYNG